MLPPLPTLGLLAVVGTMTAPSPAESALDWRSPCMTAAQARRELDAVRLDGSAGQVSVAVTAGDGGWAADVRVVRRDAVVERRIEGARCEDVSAGALIVAAGGLDGMAAGESEAESESESESASESASETESETESETASESESESESESVTESEAEFESESESESESAAPPASARGLRWKGSFEVFGEGGLAVGLLPGVTGWAGGGVGVQGERVRLEVGGQGSLPRTAGHPARASVQARVSVASGWVSGCWVLGRGLARLDAPVCVGIEAGAMTARGRGLAERGTTRAAWVAGLASARVRWMPRPWVALGLSVAVPVAMRRLAFSADDLAGPVVTSGVVDIRVGPTVAFRIPARSAPRKSTGPEKNGS